MPVVANGCSSQGHTGRLSALSHQHLCAVSLTQPTVVTVFIALEGLRSVYSRQMLLSLRSHTWPGDFIFKRKL